MRNIGLGGYLVFSSCLILISAIVIPGPATTKHVRPHQTKNQAPNKCDLICPGQSPLALPANFLQNCTSPAHNSSSHGNSTTARPRTTTTTTEGSEEVGTESSEGTETQNSTAKIGQHRRLHNRQTVHQTAPLIKKYQSNKHKLKTETVLLKREATSRLFKQHQHLKERARLDGCYVVCSEESGGGLGNDSSDSEESGSDEFEAGDNYVEGEDTPIDIIYVPSRSADNKRPSEVYQINNYELVDPQPSFGFGYDPWFFEGKHKKMKKRKHRRRIKGDSKKSNDKKLH